VVAVYDSGRDEGTGFMVMQLLSGPSLAKNDAAHKVADLLHHLGDLARSGQLNAAGYARISSALHRLTALRPAANEPPPGSH
jgi:hypothetical protein